MSSAHETRPTDPIDTHSGSSSTGFANGRSPFQDAYPFWRFEPDLLFLMSKLEQGLATAREAKGEKRLIASARMACSLINQVFNFSFSKLKPESHADAFEKSQRAHESAMELEKNLGWMIAMPSRRHTSPSPSAAREPEAWQAPYQAVGGELREALAAYFLVFAECFRDPAKSRQWLGTFRVVLDEVEAIWSP